MSHEFPDWRNDLLRKGFLLVQKLLGHAHESFLGPVVEPIDAGAVHDCGKLPSPHPQCGTNRGETEDDLQLFSHTINEELPTVLPGVHNPSTFGFIPHLVDNVLNFVVSKEVWDLSRCQQIVDQDQEFLVCDLVAILLKSFQKSNCLLGHHSSGKRFQCS